MQKSLPKLAILGAGPIGIEALIQAKASGYPVTLYEASKPGAHLERWAFVKMFTPFGWNVTAAGKAVLLREAPMRDFPADADLLTARDYRDTYLTPLAESLALKPLIQLDARVLAIGRSGRFKNEPWDAKKPPPPFRLLIRNAQGAERFETADAVLDCTGVLARPNFAGDGGLPAAGELASRPQLSYWIEDVLGAKKAHYAGRTVAVIGSGYSAAAVVGDLVQLAEEQQATWIIWLTHGTRTAPLPRLADDPLKERDRLAAKVNHLAARCEGNLEYHAGAVVDEIASLGPDKGFRLAARIGTTVKVWDVERVIACVGYRADTAIASELRIGEPSGLPETAEPGYFHLGIKSHDRDSGFLIRDGHEQIRRVFAQLAGKGIQYVGKAA